MTIDIPDGLTLFRAPGNIEFRLDIIEAHEAINRISRECSDAGLRNFEYVDQFRAGLKDKTGADLTKSQADFMIDRILTTYADEKKAVSASLSSASSTAQPSVS